MIAKMNRELRDKGNFGLLYGALLREKLMGNGTWVWEEMNSMSHGQDMELYTQREIRYLQVAMYYIGYCIKTLLRRRSQTHLHCQSFMALSGANDIIFHMWE